VIHLAVSQARLYVGPGVPLDCPKLLPNLGLAPKYFSYRLTGVAQHQHIGSRSVDYKRCQNSFPTGTLSQTPLGSSRGSPDLVVGRGGDRDTPPQARFESEAGLAQPSKLGGLRKRLRSPSLATKSNLVHFSSQILHFVSHNCESSRNICRKTSVLHSTLTWTCRTRPNSTAQKFETSAKVGFALRSSNAVCNCLGQADSHVFVCFS